MLLKYPGRLVTQGPAKEEHHLAGHPIIAFLLHGKDIFRHPHLARNSHFERFDFRGTLIRRTIISATGTLSTRKPKLALSIMRKQIDAHMRAGNRLAFIEGNLEEALLEYSQVLELDAHHCSALFGVATIHLLRKRFSQATALLRLVIEQQPNNHQALLRLAYALRQLGGLEESKTLYRNALLHQLDNRIFNRTTVLQRIIDRMDAIRYLEIGIARGENFLPLNVPRKIGVDPRNLIAGGAVRDESEEFYCMTSDEFFRTRADDLRLNPLDIVFIDGLHTHEQSFRDVVNALKVVKGNGVIVLHDCLPSSAAAAHPDLSEAKRMPGWSGQWMGDVWRTIVKLRVKRRDLRVFVLECDCGLGIVTRGKPDDTLEYSETQIAGLSYQDMNKDKIRLLNVKEPKYLLDFLEVEFGVSS